MKRIVIFLLVFLGNFTFLCSSEERPQIGLVLSGGGARGIAHIGVIKVLEEAGIEVDYITGTSMGSIVGGLYAIGYTAEELEDIILSQNWDELLLDKISQHSISMEEKADRGKYVGSFPIEEGKLSLPKGLVAGQQVHALLSKLCISVHHIEDFSQLYIPFQCIGTDIETGEVVILKEGFLPDAIRASMSIPSMFAPIEIDGVMMVDGGLVRNFPVSDAIKMGADIIIGVDVGTQLYSKKELNSLVKIMNQAVSFQSAESTRQERKLCDVLIEPSLAEFSIMDFRKAEELVALGEEAARKILPQLLELHKEQARFERVHRAIPVKDFKDLFIRKIYIQGLRKVSKNLVLGKLGIKKNDWVSSDKLGKAIERLYGSEYFEKVSYKLEPAANGVDLYVRVIEKTTSNLNFGFHYDSDLEASVLINTTFRNKLIMGSKLSIDAEMGDTQAYEISYFIHTGWKPGFGFGLTGERFEFDVPIYNDLNKKVAVYDYATNVSRFNLVTIFSNSLTLGGGIELRSVNLTPEIIQDNWLATKLDYQQMVFNGYCEVNTYDRVVYPRSGVKILADLKRSTDISHSLEEAGYLENDREPIDIGTFKISVVDRIAGNLYYEETIKCGSSVRKDSLQDDSFFFLGGMNEPQINLMPFAGYKFMALSSANFVVLESSFYYEFGEGFFGSVKGNWARLGDSFDDVFNKKQDYYGWAVTAGWVTPIGPLELSYTGGDDNNDNYFYINIGFYH